MSKALVSGFLCSSAVAAPEEIQVYMDELNAPGEIGLDIHNNYVLSGDPGVDYAGEQPSEHAPAPASLELATKLSYAISPKTAIGVENYTGTGELRRWGHFGSSEQSTYITADTSMGKWDFNVGIGRGYGSNPDKWIVKAIVSVPLTLSVRNILSGERELRASANSAL
jgi:hypothetical protein